MKAPILMMIQVHDIKVAENFIKSFNLSNNRKKINNNMNNS